MIEQTIYSKGKDRFDGNVFSFEEWSAPTMVSPEEIKEWIASFELVGRKIKRIRMVGRCCDLTRDSIEDHAYNALEGYCEEMRQRQSDYYNIASDLSFTRSTVIDEPLLIEFEDEDVFEILTQMEPEYRMSMNCIPYGIHWSIGKPNVNGNILFEPCIGKTITAVEVCTYKTNKDPVSDEFFDDAHSWREIVSEIVIWLDDETGLSISSCMIDYCFTACVDKDRKLLQVPFRKLKEALFNWEDLHVDDVTKLSAESETVFFGDICCNHMGAPYISLRPENSESVLRIAVNDFHLFDWSITLVIKERFDEYGEYKLSDAQWNQVLAKAEYMVGLETFDELFDYLTDAPRNEISLLYPLNHNGAQFWKNRERYRLQFEDVRKWSNLVMTKSGHISIYGF